MGQTKQLATGRVSDEILDGFRKVSVIAIADALDSVLHLPGIISRLHPLVDGYRFVGRAVTVHFVPTSAFDDYHKFTSTEAAEFTSKGDVIVCAANGLEQAIWGDQQASEAKRRQLAGAVIDGYLRDVVQLKKLDMPVFSRGRNPAPVRGHGRREAINVPIQVCGMLVNPGDVIAADEDGIVVIAAARAEEVLKISTEIHESELLVIEDYEQGRDLLQSRAERLPEYLRPWYLREKGQHK